MVRLFRFLKEPCVLFVFACFSLYSCDLRCYLVRLFEFSSVLDWFCCRTTDPVCTHMCHSQGRVQRTVCEFSASAHAESSVVESLLVCCEFSLWSLWSSFLSVV